MDGSEGAADAGATQFSEVYRKHAADVRRFALFLSGNEALADDIVSETFIRVWKARARVDLTTVKAYLFAIARNLFLEERRRTKRIEAAIVEVADPRADPHQQADARAELRAVLEALQGLPEVDRSAVLMRADAGLPYEDIARALGISESVAKVKVHRARMKLGRIRS